MDYLAILQYNLLPSSLILILILILFSCILFASIFFIGSNDPHSFFSSDFSFSARGRVILMFILGIPIAKWAGSVMVLVVLAMVALSYYSVVILVCGINVERMEIFLFLYLCFVSFSFLLCGRLCGRL